MSNSTSISSTINQPPLGQRRAKDVYEPYVELAGCRRRPAQGLDLSARFIVKMVVLFVAVGGGTHSFDASGFSWYDVKLAVFYLSSSG